MATVNKVMLIGNLTRDPELRYTPGGAAVCEFAIALNRSFTNKQTGQREEEVSYIEIVLGYVGAAATKSILLGLIILATAGFFVPLEIAHPLWMLAFLVLTAVTFSLFGFIIGIWADGFEQLQFVPLLVITPLTFLGGTFYSISVLPPVWQTVTLFNPLVYLVSGFRWSFYEIADVSVGISLGVTCLFLLICLAAVWWIFRTGYRLKS